MSLELARLTSRNVRYAQVLGGILFIVSFLLPAVLLKDDGGWGDRGPFSGFRCAISSLPILIGTLANLLNPSMNPRDVLDLLLFLLSAFINPSILFYLVSNRKFQRIIAIIILACMVSSWIGAILTGTKLLIGYFAWIIGVLLILAPELSKKQRYEEPDEDIDFYNSAGQRIRR
jgi:hypothetical protein